MQTKAVPSNRRASKFFSFNPSYFFSYYNYLQFSTCPILALSLPGLTWDVLRSTALQQHTRHSFLSLKTCFSFSLWKARKTLKAPISAHWSDLLTSSLPTDVCQIPLWAVSLSAGGWKLSKSHQVACEEQMMRKALNIEQPSTLHVRTWQAHAEVTTSVSIALQRHLKVEVVLHL